MDNNDMYQNNQAAGTEPDNNQMPQSDYNQNGYQQDAYSQNSYQQGGQNNYQQGNYDQNAYQQGNYDQNAYQQGNYSQNAYQQGNYGQNPYQNANYQQYPYQNYNNYNGNMPPQLDLEEPVKMSEWIISFLIMMVPCVNIVMTFVWAFSKTEKKSKSNFFKAYLVMLGIMLALYLVAIVLLVALGLSSDIWY